MPTISFLINKSVLAKLVSYVMAERNKLRTEAVSALAGVQTPAPATPAPAAPLTVTQNIAAMVVPPNPAALAMGATAAMLGLGTHTGPAFTHVPTPAYSGPFGTYGSGAGVNLQQIRNLVEQSVPASVSPAGLRASEGTWSFTSVAPALACLRLPARQRDTP
jgi:hypothetical protein